MSTLLVVEDHQATARALARLLVYEGHEVAVAMDGYEAMRALEAKTPELVLLDQLLPGMDGTEVLRAVRADPRFDGVHIIMYSALSEPNRIGDALRLGAQDYIVKGTPWPTVRVRINAVLARSQN